jgi:hypothetical protein
MRSCFARPSRSSEPSSRAAPTETDFLAYQASVVPLAAAQPGGLPTAARFGTRRGCTSEHALTVRSK